MRAKRAERGRPRSACFARQFFFFFARSRQGACSQAMVVLPRKYNSSLTSLSLGDINQGRTKKTITPEIMSSPRFVKVD